MKYLHLFIYGIFCLLAGCSLILDWDPEGLSCSADGVCADGYVCRFSQCIEKNSLLKDEICNEDIQCQQGFICGGNFKCTTECHSYYERSLCEKNRFCSAQLIDYDSSYFRGYCVKGDDCIANEDCSMGEVCLLVDNDVSVCLSGCEIHFNDVGEYSDNCGRNIDICQPLGINKQLVCIEQYKGNFQQAGEICDFGAFICESGAACINGICRNYCNLSLGDSLCGEDICCDKTRGRQSFAICEPDCNF